MIDTIINKLPIELQNDIDSLSILGKNGWSKAWNDKAHNIIMKLNELRDNDVITSSDWNYINNNYLKSIGNINENNTDFFNFFLKGNESEISDTTQHSTALAKQARKELLENGFVAVLCPKCQKHPEITTNTTGERTVIHCQCGYIVSAEINF